jgi:hypothetical protein
MTLADSRAALEARLREIELAELRRWAEWRAEEMAREARVAGYLREIEGRG